MCKLYWFLLQTITILLRKVCVSVTQLLKLCPYCAKGSGFDYHVVSKGGRLKRQVSKKILRLDRSNTQGI